MLAGLPKRMQVDVRMQLRVSPRGALAFRSYHIPEHLLGGESDAEGVSPSRRAASKSAAALYSVLCLHRLPRCGTTRLLLRLALPLADPSQRARWLPALLWSALGVRPARGHGGGHVGGGGAVQGAAGSEDVVMAGRGGGEEGEGRDAENEIRYHTFDNSQPQQQQQQQQQEQQQWQWRGSVVLGAQASGAAAVVCCCEALVCCSSAVATACARATDAVVRAGGARRGFGGYGYGGGNGNGNGDGNSDDYSAGNAYNDGTGEGEHGSSSQASELALLLLPHLRAALTVLPSVWQLEGGGRAGGAEYSGSSDEGGEEEGQVSAGGGGSDDDEQQQVAAPLLGGGAAAATSTAAGIAAAGGGAPAGKFASASALPVLSAAGRRCLTDVRVLRKLLTAATACVGAVRPLLRALASAPLMLPSSRQQQQGGYM